MCIRDRFCRMLYLEQSIIWYLIDTEGKRNKIFGWFSNACVEKIVSSYQLKELSEEVFEASKILLAIRKRKGSG